MIPNMSSKFQLSSMIRSVLNIIVSSSVTWRTLRVPYQMHTGYEIFFALLLILTFDSLPMYQIQHDYKIVKSSLSSMGILRGHCGFLTRDFEDRVFLDKTNILDRPPWAMSIPWKYKINIFIFGKVIRVWCTHRQTNWQRLQKLTIALLVSGYVLG